MAKWTDKHSEQLKKIMESGRVDVSEFSANTKFAQSTVRDNMNKLLKKNGWKAIGIWKENIVLVQNRGEDEEIPDPKSLQLTGKDKSSQGNTKYLVKCSSDLGRLWLVTYAKDGIRAMGNIRKSYTGVDPISAIKAEERKEYMKEFASIGRPLSTFSHTLNRFK